MEAHDKLRLLISQYRLPVEVPETLGLLQKIGREFKLDGPGIVTEVRNSITHPNHKRASKYAEAIPEAWLLMLWYIELVFLSL